ncbi:hypothetical protein BGZ98_007681 [Dissophora globulifera]|nr:hypothetical protein BGZ98_007681 [Dissophora globulifera]
MQHQQLLPQHSPASEPVHCFWALMTYGDLRFIYLSSSVQRAVSAKYKQLLGQSFFDYIHPDEAKLARKDLNAFMDVHNLYGSVTRCRFKNVCPEWQQRRLARHPGAPNASAAALQAAATEGGLSSRNLGLNGSHTDNTGCSDNPVRTTSTTTVDSGASRFDNDKLSTLSAAAAALSEAQQRTGNAGRKPDDNCKDYEDAFQNGEEDDFMILDVVMNVVSDEVVLGFFHIDGQGPYKGFWSNGICGESKESLATLSPEIMRHLRDSVAAKAPSTDARSDSASPSSSPRRQSSDQKTKRIFQLYDSQNRNLLLTWPEPGTGVDQPGTMAYNPGLYTQIVKSHHIPVDALDNTTCLKRFCSKHALPNLDPTSQEISYQVESVFIPYGHIIFACFQTSPATPANNWCAIGSPPGSTSTAHGSHLLSASPGGRPFGSGYDSSSSGDHLSGLGLLSSPSQPGSASFGVAGAHGTPSAVNSPLVIPTLPSRSPFSKPAVVGQMAMASGQTSSPSTSGPIRNKSVSGSHSSAYHPYAASSPSNLSIPESMQESLSFLGDYKAGEQDRGRGNGSPGERGVAANDGSSHSVWNASTPHPAIAAMVGHALSPSSPSFQRSVTGTEGKNAHARQKSSSLSTVLGKPAELHHSGTDRDLKGRKLPSSPRHPAHDAAIRKKSSSSASSSSPPTLYQDADGSVASSGGHVLRAQQEEKACESCGTTNSPEWRRGQSGKKDLCNACGLRYSRSVARQNRQAQKQLEGKGPKSKSAKPAKGAKTHSKKETGALLDGAGGGATDQSFIQDSMPLQQPAQQQAQHLAQAFGSTSYGSAGAVPSYPMAVSQSSFYHAP